MFRTSAPGLSRSVAFRRDDSAEDLAARVRVADEEVARARAEQKAASDRLAREEAALTRGVTELSLRPKPADWLAVKTGESLVRRRTSRSVPSQQDDAATLAAGKLLPEVVACDDFIGRTGIYGGWHPQDAADFDHAVAAARGNYSHAIRICLDTMPTLGEDEVRAHACWHREAAELAAGKRDALDRWRAARRAERQAAAAAGSDETAAAGASVQAAAEAEQQARMRSTREAIAQWRAEKAAAEAAAAAAEAEAAQRRAAAERDRWDAQQRQRRALLQPFLSEKEAQAAAAAQAAAEEVARRRPVLTQEALERVRARQEIMELRQRAALEEAGRAAAMQRERTARLKQQVYLLQSCPHQGESQGLHNVEAALGMSTMQRDRNTRLEQQVCSLMCLKTIAVC